jgi:hypothetical protein
MGDIHTLTLKIKEDIEFLRGMNVKLNPEKFSQAWETNWLALFGS